MVRYMVVVSYLNSDHFSTPTLKSRRSGEETPLKCVLGDDH